MRILILYDKPIHDASEASGVTLRELAEFLTHFNNEVFAISMGKQNDYYTKNFEELCIKSKNSAKKAILISTFGNISLKLFHKPIFYYRDILEKIERFGPNLIITHGLASLSVDFASFLAYYKLSHPDVKIIAITDDVRQIEEYIKIKQNLLLYNKRLPSSFTSFIIKVYGIAVKQIAYGMYDTMVKNFDGILFFTREDLSYAVKRYHEYKRKFFIFRRPVKADKNDSHRYILRNKLNMALFVGNCRHLPNVEAMHNIFDIADKVNDVNFIITGAECAKGRHKNINVVGFVNNLNALYLKADVFIAPLKSGSGMKMKLLECFRYGIPIIGTSIAFEGYPVRDNIHCIIEDDIKKYPKIINRLKADYQLRKRLSENSKEILEYFSYKEANVVWQNIIKSI